MERSRILGNLSEDTFERNLAARRIPYSRPDFLGVRYPTVDFILYLLEIKVYVEIKNHLNKVTEEYFLANILAKFVHDDPYHKGLWVLIVPRASSYLKELCGEYGIRLIETGQQLVTKDIHQTYNKRGKKYSTTSTQPIYKAINQLFKAIGGSLEIRTAADDSIVEYAKLSLDKSIICEAETTNSPVSTAPKSPDLSFLQGDIINLPEDSING